MRYQMMQPHYEILYSNRYSQIDFSQQETIGFWILDRIITLPFC